MEPVYGIEAALKVFERHGYKISRQGFNDSLLKHMAAVGVAKLIGERVWAFDPIELSHWADYAVKVQERKAAGTLPGNYEYNEWDCQLVTDGMWDD